MPLSAGRVPFWNIWPMPLTLCSVIRTTCGSLRRLSMLLSFMRWRVREREGEAKREEAGLALLVHSD